MSTITVDNLLHFVATNFDTFDRQKIDSLLVDFYTIDELVASKLLLVAECKKIHITDSILENKKRRLFTKSEIEKGGLFQTTFVGTDPPRLPQSLLIFPPSATTTATATATANDNHVEPDLHHVISLLLSLKKRF